MEKEVMEFTTPQQKITVCNGGKKVLVLLNERKVESVMHNIVPDDSLNEENRADESYNSFLYDGYWLDVSNNSANGIVESARRMMLEEVDKFDSSGEVNGIIINGQSVWIDKNTRMGLRQNIADKKAVSQSNITMWMGETPITMPCDKAEEWMCKIENYAYDCFNVTAYHKANIQSLTSLEDILAYDVTIGYPEKINISL